MLKMMWFPKIFTMGAVSANSLNNAKNMSLQTCVKRIGCHSLAQLGGADYLDRFTGLPLFTGRQASASSLQVPLLDPQAAKLKCENVCLCRLEMNLSIDMKNTHATTLSTYTYNMNVILVNVAFAKF